MAQHPRRGARPPGQGSESSGSVDSGVIGGEGAPDDVTGAIASFAQSRIAYSIIRVTSPVRAAVASP